MIHPAIGCIWMNHFMCLTAWRCQNSGYFRHKVVGLTLPSGCLGAYFFNISTCGNTTNSMFFLKIFPKGNWALVCASLPMSAGDFVIQCRPGAYLPFAPGQAHFWTLATKSGELLRVLMDLSMFSHGGFSSVKVWEHDGTCWEMLKRVSYPQLVHSCIGFYIHR